MSNRTVYAMGVHFEGMFSTVATCVGIDAETKEVVRFGVDHRPANALGRAIVAAGEAGELPPLAELEDWQVLSVSDPDPEITPEGI